MQHKVSHKRLLRYLTENSPYNLDLYRYKFVNDKSKDDEQAKKNALR